MARQCSCAKPERAGVFVVDRFGLAVEAHARVLGGVGRQQGGGSKRDLQALHLRGRDGQVVRAAQLDRTFVVDRVHDRGQGHKDRSALLARLAYPKLDMGEGVPRQRSSGVALALCAGRLGVRHHGQIKGVAFVTWRECQSDHAFRGLGD